MKSEVTRRLFLSQTALSMIGFAAAARPLSCVSNDRLSDDAGLTVRNQLLDMVNRERRDAGLHILELDELACRVAEAHAIDMAQGGFLSHWGTDGRKPYQRYSFAGGIDAIEENDGASDHGAPVAFYEDGSSGTIELLGPKFQVRIALSKKLPGIYTIVVWLQRSGTSHSFPATQICVRAE